MEHEEIRQYMLSTSSFVEQGNCLGRRFDYFIDGVKVAHIWFKYTLGGWKMIIGKKKEVYHVDSLQKLKTLLSL